MLKGSAELVKLNERNFKQTETSSSPLWNGSEGHPWKDCINQSKSLFRFQVLFYFASSQWSGHCVTFQFLCHWLRKSLRSNLIFQDMIQKFCKQWRPCFQAFKHNCSSCLKLLTFSYMYRDSLLWFKTK